MKQSIAVFAEVYLPNDDSSLPRCELMDVKVVFSGVRIPRGVLTDTVKDTMGYLTRDNLGKTLQDEPVPVVDMYWFGVVIYAQLYQKLGSNLERVIINDRRLGSTEEFEITFHDVDPYYHLSGVPGSYVVADDSRFGTHAHMAPKMPTP